MDIAVNLALDEEIIDSFSVFVLAGVSGSENGTYSNCVLVDKVHSLFGIDHVAIFGAVDVLLFDIEVPAGFLQEIQLGLSCVRFITNLPANLYSRVHDQVWVFGRLALSLALYLPTLLHSKNSQL